MNLPTKITVFRIILIPIFVALALVNSLATNIPYTRIIATVVFIVASLTDILDGYLARKNNQVTDLGKFLDPIADKLLVTAALIIVTVYPSAPEAHADIFQMITVIFTMIIIFRELAIGAFRMIAATKNLVLAADMLGKIKTVLQMSALIVLLLVPDFFVSSDWLYYTGFGLLALATVMTVISGCNYFFKNRAVLKEATAEPAKDEKIEEEV